MHAIQTGNLVKGSVARVIDCCSQEIDPFECISKLGGICSESDYPTTTGQCVPNACQPQIHVCTSTYIYKNVALLCTRMCDSIEKIITWVFNRKKPIVLVRKIFQKFRASERGYFINLHTQYASLSKNMSIIRV